MAFDLSKPGAAVNLITGNLIGNTGSVKFFMRVHQFQISYDPKMMEATGDGSVNTLMEHSGRIAAVLLLTGWILASQAPKVATLYDLTNNAGQTLSINFGTNWVLTQTMVAGRIVISGAKTAASYSMALTAYLSGSGVTGTGA